MTRKRGGLRLAFIKYVAMSQTLVREQSAVEIVENNRE
jgi:hypothetical protein